MLGNYYYNQIIRKCVVGFGTLFNNIEIRKFNDDGTVYQRMKVPLAYGPREKFLARLTEQPELGRPNAITLPRLSFEMVGMSYDPTRKQSPIQYCLSNADEEGLRKTYMPVPYNLEFELNILSRTQDDALQIIEQIVPFFQPSFNISIKLVEDAAIVKDIPIVLTTIDFNDQYEGSFEDRRVITYTLRFSIKTYIYGPSTDVGEIKKSIVKEYANTDRTIPSRYRQYEVTPKALDDINSDGVINAIDDSLLTSDDDFGFNESVSYFS